jgi:hypothetical protein
MQKPKTIKGIAMTMCAWLKFPGILKGANRCMKPHSEEGAGTKMKHKEKQFAYIDEGSIHFWMLQC